MARCGLASMEVHVLIDPYVAQATLQLFAKYIPGGLVGHTASPI